MKKNQLITLVVLLAAIAAAIYYFSRSNTDEAQQDIVSAVKYGPFKVSVSATGELEAKRSKKIMGPSSMRNAQIYETTIQSLVPEGTEVKEGAFVAQLDKTEVANKMADIQAEIDKILTQLDQVKIDTSIEMRGLRDQMVNVKFSKEETKLQVELSKYEPQAVIRQKNIEFEKIEREYEQLRVKLGLTKDKNMAKIAEITASLNQQKVKMKRLLELSDEFTIKAPADGMVIYARGWEGKVSSGSRLRAWDPVVAELPDLTEMISKTYVNEVDISKVSIGQDTRITVDAFPDAEYTGTVQQVANIGEQLRNYDTKVFEVIVSVNEQDSILRPAMTTGIEVIISDYDSVSYIPLEALYKDSVNYVFKKVGGKISKQEVVVGPSNDLDIIIAGGLEKGQEVLLTKPKNADDMKILYFDGERKKAIMADLEKKEEERSAVLEEKKKTLKNDIERKEESSNRIIIFN
jgi:multidrug efflux pump subunit AcrA (membrane-fusion protein)